MLRLDIGSDEEGAALIEAALVLPVLLVLVFGLVEMCLYMWQLSSAGKAVQLGLRYAIVSDPAARGPGLTRALSTQYWVGRQAGFRCEPPANGPAPCPTFDLRCSAKTGCVCDGSACNFTFSAPAFDQIVSTMRAVLPSLAAENVEVRYATNGAGYVGRPAPVPVDVTVRLINLSYRPLLLPDLFGARLPLQSSVSMAADDLLTD